MGVCAHVCSVGGKRSYQTHESISGSVSTHTDTRTHTQQNGEALEGCVGVTNLVEDGHILTLQDSGFVGETWRSDRPVTMATKMSFNANDGSPPPSISESIQVSFMIQISKQF